MLPLPSRKALPMFNILVQHRDGLPAGLHDATYATWRAVISEMRDTKDRRYAAERHQFCGGYLQALVDAHVIHPTDYAQVRAQLMHAWSETLNRLN